MEHFESDDMDDKNIEYNNDKEEYNYKNKNWKKKFWKLKNKIAKKIINI